MQATLDAIEVSDLNCFSFVDAERALAAAENADVSKPFGGVPTGIKELDEGMGVPHKDVANWLRTWGRKRERKAPRV